MFWGRAWVVVFVSGFKFRLVVLVVLRKMERVVVFLYGVLDVFMRKFTEMNTVFGLRLVFDKY